MSKKSILLITLYLIIFCICIIIAPSCAENLEKKQSGDWEYVVLGNNTIRITKYSGEESHLTIPSEIDGNTVVSLGDHAFSYSRVTSVTIPNSVTSTDGNPFANSKVITSIIVPPDHPVFMVVNDTLYNNSTKTLIAHLKTSRQSNFSVPKGILEIGPGAFWYCDALTDITIPDSVITINDFAFYTCISLTNVSIPSSVTSIGEFAFCDCRVLKQLILPDSIETIGDNAFSSCTSLMYINIPNKVTSISNQLFDTCTSLRNITIPANVTYIGSSSFSGCESLTQITIPDSVTDIGRNPFSGCRSLTSVYVSPDHPVFATINNNLYNKVRKSLLCYLDSSMQSSFTIPQGILEIGSRAFSDCNSLRSVTIPDTVTTIAEYAFCECSSLTSISLPDSITTIAKCTFSNCSSLTSISIPNSVTSIENLAFSQCSSLTNLTIPDSVSAISASAFMWDQNLVLTVEHNSYAQQYCIDNHVKYQYPNGLDWLNN